MAGNLRKYGVIGRTRQFAAIASVNGIKLAVATNVAPQTYTGATLDGALANPGPARTWMRIVAINTTASGGTYNTTDPIVITGTDQAGVARTANVMLTLAGGNETVFSAVGFDTVTQIAVPAQLGGGGQFQFGVQDILPDVPLCGVFGAAGNVVVLFPDGRGDTFTIIAGQEVLVPIARIVSQSTTALPLAALFPH